jgi:2-hydroxychromene-2-carboxylate isomerase/ketosteroid isomerase-like protein
MSEAPIRVLFDFISPYAYLAWTQVHDLAARHRRAVEPVPVLFAAMLDAWGNKGPAEIPPKRAYMFKDALRRARRVGVTLTPPPTHPFNPLLALRVASLPMDAATQRALITALFRATWAGGGGVTDPAAVAAIADAVGLDGGAAVRAAGEPEAKERLRAQTAAAIAGGAFGVPTLLVDGELYWGFDAFDAIDARLRGDDAVDEAALRRWRDLEPSSVRRALRPQAPVALRPEDLRARAEAWIDAWNRRDLEAILAHYADDVAVCSPRVVERLGAADGWLRGKAALRDYFAQGLRNPALRFELVDVAIGVGAMTVVYRRESGALVTDCAELDAEGRIVRMVACYGPPG